MLGGLFRRLVLPQLSFLYGLTHLLTFLSIAAIRDGAFFNRTSKEEEREFTIAQEQYWSVKKSPLPGFSHQFFTLRNGVRLHYVVKTERVVRLDGAQLPHDTVPAGPQNVAVFLHGFPDSFLLWKRMLCSRFLDSHILIAVDLPGYGGSDGLQTYSANEILESITEFILGMREKYLKEEARLVVVSHDWGAVIAARLASEASQLADRWVISSALVPHHAYSNIVTKVASAQQMLHTYLRQPLRISLLKNALVTMRPVTIQFRKSFYIFIFNLPWPLSTIFPTFGNYWFLRLLHSTASGHIPDKLRKVRKLTPKEAGEAMTSAAGPSEAQINEPNGYSPTLKSRLRNNGMLEKIRIYREGLFLGTWEKSIEIVVALSELQSESKRSSGGSGAGLFDEGPRGTLKAPATVLYGERDPAFERRLGLDGLVDYLAKDSHVIVLKDSGHWLPVEKLGSGLIEEVATWALSGEVGKLDGRLRGREDVQVTAV